MGLPKALLPFGELTMLECVAGRLAEVARPIVVVAAPDQPLPDLPAAMTVVHDERPGRGPLEGLRMGLSALSGRAAGAYVTSCDAPLLAPGFVRRLAELIGKHDAAVPEIDGQLQPLAALYRTSLLPLVEELADADRFGPIELCRRANIRPVTADELRPVDPQLDSLRSANEPAEYLKLLERAGIVPSPDVLASLEQRS